MAMLTSKQVSAATLRCKTLLSMNATDHLNKNTILVLMYLATELAVNSDYDGSDILITEDIPTAVRMQLEFIYTSCISKMPTTQTDHEDDDAQASTVTAAPMSTGSKWLMGVVACTAAIIVGGVVGALASDD